MPEPRLVIVQVDYQTAKGSAWTHTHAAVTAEDHEFAHAVARMTAVPWAASSTWDSQDDARTLTVASYPLDYLIAPAPAQTDA